MLRKLSVLTIVLGCAGVASAQCGGSSSGYRTVYYPSSTVAPRVVSSAPAFVPQPTIISSQSATNFTPTQPSVTFVPQPSQSFVPSRPATSSGFVPNIGSAGGGSRAPQAFLTPGGRIIDGQGRTIGGNTGGGRPSIGPATSGSRAPQLTPIFDSRGRVVGTRAR